MSGEADFQDERDALAAEYVLGSLDGPERAHARRMLLRDPEFVRYVRAWEARLAPMADGVPPMPPPESVWPRIEASLDEAEHAPAAPVAVRSRAAFWRGTTFAASALAAGLAAFIVLRTPAPSGPVQAVLSASGSPAFVASVERGGAILVRAVGTPTVPTGHDLELWVLPAGATRPESLGVLPSAGKQVPRGVATAPGTQLLVSLEPTGGSPTGQPTGPVVYAGKLEQL
jgi:anti-sigma-K factor RskA